MSETQQQFWWSLILAATFGVVRDGFWWWLIGAFVFIIVWSNV